MLQQLEYRNHSLLHDVEAIIDDLGDHPPFDEIALYHENTVLLCKQIQQQIRQNQLLLKFVDDADILANIISGTQVAIRFSQLLDSVIIPPIGRANEADRLSLTILHWLHQTHKETSKCGVALSNGNWGVKPLDKFNLAIYYVPRSEQYRLLYLPIFFHEFGHILYSFHAPEMDALVEDIQHRILELLTPMRRRNDIYDRKRMLERQSIAYIWYKWIQELFCDAVGFTTGGPCFLMAFESYLMNFHPRDFHAKPQELAESTHPITWLRIRFLVERARNNGYPDLANAVDRTWQAVAQSFKVEEEYYGFYDAVLKDDILQTIEDMLVEANPRQFNDQDANVSNSPITLLNTAWNTYKAGANDYKSWESEQIQTFIGKREGISSSVSKD